MQGHIRDVEQYLEQVEEASGAEIAQKIGLSTERTRVILANMDSVEPIGSNRNRKYKLKKWLR